MSVKFKKMCVKNLKLEKYVTYPDSIFFSIYISHSIHFVLII